MQEEERETGTGNHTSTNEATSSIELLILFQRLLLCIIYSHIATSNSSGEGRKDIGTGDWSEREGGGGRGERKGRNFHLFVFFSAEQDSHVQGAILVLGKYVTMLHEHIGHIMPTALHMAQISQDHFTRVGAILQRGPMGVILPEISLGLVLLQLRMPLLLQVYNICMYCEVGWSG